MPSYIPLLECTCPVHLTGIAAVSEDAQLGETWVTSRCTCPRPCWQMATLFGLNDFRILHRIAVVARFSRLWCRFKCMWRHRVVKLKSLRSKILAPKIPHVKQQRLWKITNHLCWDPLRFCTIPWSDEQNYDSDCESHRLCNSSIQFWSILP